MDKLHLTAQNLGPDFNFRNDPVHAVNFLGYAVKLPNLKLKSRPKQLSGALPYDIGLPTLLSYGVGSSSGIHEAFSNKKAIFFQINFCHSFVAF